MDLSVWNLDCFFDTGSWGMSLVCVAEETEESNDVRVDDIAVRAVLPGFNTGDMSIDRMLKRYRNGYIKVLGL